MRTSAGGNISFSWLSFCAKANRIRWFCRRRVFSTLLGEKESKTSDTGRCDPAGHSASYSTQYGDTSEYAGLRRAWQSGSTGELGLKANVFDGIVGMIRFGTGKSAELYLTLGDLLAIRGDKHLAYRAYQRALELDPPAKAYLQEVLKELPHFSRGRV